jgi:hypothetical protein
MCASHWEGLNYRFTNKTQRRNESESFIIHFMNNRRREDTPVSRGIGVALPRRLEKVYVFIYVCDYRNALRAYTLGPERW